MKIPNPGLSVFLSASAGRVYELQVRSPCRMRYLHYPTLENTRSIKKLRTNMNILLNNQSLWRIIRTSANDIRYSRINILFINFIFLAILSELLIHRLGSPKCVVTGISVCSDFFFIKRISKRKIRISAVPPSVTTA